MLLAAFSLWTVIPFGWIWIGSKVSSSQAPSAGPYMIVFFGIVISIILVVFILAWLNRLYERLVGTTKVHWSASCSGAASATSARRCGAGR